MWYLRLTINYSECVGYVRNQECMNIHALLPPTQLQGRFMSHDIAFALWFVITEIGNENISRIGSWPVPCLPSQRVKHPEWSTGMKITAASAKIRAHSLFILLHEQPSGRYLKYCWFRLIFIAHAQKIICKKAESAIMIINFYRSMTIVQRKRVHLTDTSSSSKKP